MTHTSSQLNKYKLHDQLFNNLQTYFRNEEDEDGNQDQ